MANEESEAGETPEGEAPGRGRTSIPPEATRAFRRLEKIVPEALRKGLEKGIEAGLSSWEKSVESAMDKTGAVREALGDTKLPRELAAAIFQQIDDTKNGVLRVVAGEFRDFLEATDISGELKKALTSLSFEIRTEVRFIPNEAGSGVRPQVKAASKVKGAGGKRASTKPEPAKPEPAAAKPDASFLEFEDD